MQFLVCHFMKQCLNGLYFTHAILNHNFFVFQMIESLGISINQLKRYRDRADFLQCLQELGISFNISHQFRRTDGRKFFSICLGQVKCLYHLECPDCDFHFLLYRFSISIKYRSSLIIQFCLFPLDLIRCRGKDTDSLFSLFHIPSHLFPSGKALTQLRIRFLHHDQK